MTIKPSKKKKLNTLELVLSKKKQFFHLLFQTQEEGRKGEMQPRKRWHARRKMMTKTVSHSLSWTVMVTHWE